MLLELKNTSVFYGKVQATHDVSISVPEGQIVTLIGSNGAGKSTTLRMISGLERPQTGDVLYDGESILSLPPEKITGIGIAHVPEGRRVFPQMTVMENLEMGAYLRSESKEMAHNLDLVFSHFPRLKERVSQHAGTMSGGEQQMLAMGRALMSNPKLVLMDEPTLGLSPIMCQEIAGIIKKINNNGRTIVLVEQNARLALALADYGYVLDTGEVVIEGVADKLREDDDIQKTYLGLG
ncbi:MAG: ABC transporter ATP-binding protein [Silicimonas sp.]|nr:ABC transporter ATP-binding protein [Silicimonas sp.]